MSHGTEERAHASVAPTYVHYDKRIDPGKPLALRGTALKWYNLARPQTPIPDAVVATARAFLLDQPGTVSAKESGTLGFVVLHRCGDGYYLLLLSTWRNENEVWESIYAMDTQSPAAQDFPHFHPVDFPGRHRGTYCVWELAAVWHEQQAWKRFLRSRRDEAAQAAYLADLYAGEA